MNKPLVSVAMVVRNVDRFLSESIGSILSQTFTDFEFVIVDFGSTDNSKSIISSYAARDSRMKLHEIDQGYTEARNAAASLAQGKYIAIMDADDVSVPSRLMWEVALLEAHPDVGLVGGATEWIDAKGREWGIHHNPTEDHEIRLAFDVYHPFFHPTLLIRRSVFEQVGGYRTQLTPAEDYDLTMRMSEHCKCANLKQVVLKYRIHSHQQSLQRKTQQTLCKLAVQASALKRRGGSMDPMDSVQEITPAVLIGLGVTHARQQHEVAFDNYQWIRNMCAVGEYSMALSAARALMKSDLRHVERWLIADLRLLVARLYWKQKGFVRSLFIAAHALVARPIMLGRPIKSLWRRGHFLDRGKLASSQTSDVNAQSSFAGITGKTR